MLTNVGTCPFLLSGSTNYALIPYQAFSSSQSLVEVDTIDTPYLLGNTNGSHSQLIETLSTEDLAKVKAIEYFKPQDWRYVKIDVETIKILHQLQITDFYLRKFLNQDISLEKVIGLSSLFPKLKGERLFKKIWHIAKVPETTEFDEWLQGNREKCFIRDPNDPNALVLIANTDENGYFHPNYGSNPSFFKKLSTTYNICMRKINSLFDFCNTIDTQAKQEPINLLIIMGHGTPDEIVFRKYFNFISGINISDSFPSESCLHNLAPNATIILDSCSTGAFNENFLNLANHIANNAPSGTKIFSPNKPVYFKDIISLSPLEVKMRTVSDNDERLSEDVTYRIELGNKARHCSSNGISALNFCTQNPLFRWVKSDPQNTMGYSFEFYNAADHQWAQVSPDALQYIYENHFSNQALEKISDYGLNLNDFVEEAKKITRTLSPNDLINQVIVNHMRTISSEDSFSEVLLDDALTMNSDLPLELARTIDSEDVFFRYNQPTMLISGSRVDERKKRSSTCSAKSQTQVARLN